ncbi:hypothetical protein HOK31_09950 [Candidatus Poribacteria bacterium]|nr:hypothetical protein [Candidatus Poribacteria bacterium]MBT7099464.1 hypothetical protein [Candidatus Poribacteria bacterium]MBT7808001.1 hypothetical protein [Candidatus Poribacteria bacterium]
MMRYGEDARRQAGRGIGEVVTPPEARLATLVSLMTVAERRPHRVVAADGAFVVPQGGADVSAGSLAPIAVDADRLTTFLREQYGIGIVDISEANGRYNGAQNELRVRLVTDECTEAEALHDFMLICAGVYGMDSERTVDVVRASAVDGSLQPWLDLGTTMDAFDEYRRGDLDLAGWVRGLDRSHY